LIEGKMQGGSLAIVTDFYEITMAAGPPNGASAADTVDRKSVV